MEKFTKIVATIGPASEDIDTIRKMHEAGMDVARLNFSHGSHEYFKGIISRIRKASDKIAIILDTKGPEIRTGEVENGELILKDGQKLCITGRKIVGNETMISMDYPGLNKVEKGNMILIDDGLIETEVMSKSKDGLIVKVLNGGILGSRKTVTIRGHSVEIPFLSKKDKEDIMFGMSQGLSFIAASFVRSEKDVLQLRKFVDRHNPKVKIISKIEHEDAVKNIKGIIENSDGIMVARGDLGVEMPLEKVPEIQSNIIHSCNELGKPVIVATQMLESMKSNPRPTRAEVSDVAQAILQGADAVMLSGETANGKYPVNSVRMMAKIAKEYDGQVKNKILDNMHLSESRKRNAIALFVTKAAFHASRTLNAKAILTPTETGYTARNVSRFKPRCPIIAMTRDKVVMRQLSLSWGVIPMIETRNYTRIHDMVKELIKKSYNEGLISKEDTVVITAGYKMAQKGSTNLIEVYEVGEVIGGK